MAIWQSLEARFAGLRGPIALKRNRRGETISFEPGRPDLQTDFLRFKALATIAGVHLVRLDSQLGLDLPLPEAPPAERWYEALFDTLRLGRPGLLGWGVNPDGTQGETLTQTDLADANGASMALCLHLEALEAVSKGVSLSEKLASPRYRMVQQHLAKAHAFREADISDLPNSAKEAASALEGMARILLDDKSVTLGKAVDRLRTKLGVPAGFAKAMDGLWAFTSDTEGVRHGATESMAVTNSEADFVIQVSEACVAYLLQRDAD